MRSPGDSGPGFRVMLERIARGVALAVLLWLLVQALRDRPAPVQATVRGQDLPSALSRWSTAAAPAGVHVRSDESLAPFQRDWLAALPGAGTRVTWDGSGPAPIAVAVEPVADPEGGTSAWIAAPRGTAVLVEDAVGRLDSLRAAGGGARLLVRSNPNELRARTGASIARSAVTDSLVLGRLLLLGAAGWESKFVAAALEERGWKLDARLRLSPRGDVRQGTAAPIDTGRYSAVIVLDSFGSVEARGLLAFVGSGGGVVLSALAARTPGLTALSAGPSGPPQPGREPFDTSAAEPRRWLELIPIIPGADAVVLEWRGSHAAVAARRIERGRVVMTGYQDTWRWRLAGGDGAVRDHRDWWAHLVAGVARTGRVAKEPMPDTDEAPRVALIARLGPSSAAPAETRPGFTLSRTWLFALLAAALLLEWTSRRLRGAP